MTPDASQGRDTQCRETSVEDIQAKCTDPALGQVAGAFPANPVPMANRPGWANTYLPSTGRDRLLWVTQYFVAHGMYVVLDYQPQDTEKHAFDVATFSAKWARLWTALGRLPTWEPDLKGRVIVDLMNEPDSIGMHWEAKGRKPGVTQLFLAAMDALWAVQPEGLLFMVEGTSQSSWGLNWGNGFVTEPDTLRTRGLSDPRPFLQQLLGKPYLDRVIIAPHCYPPSITGSVLTGRELVAKFTRSFGYLAKQGFSSGGRCHRFPLVIGEFGSAFQTAEDRQWLGEFAQFMACRGAADTGQHEVVSSWFWWAYNANSGDTGGIVTDDWQAFNWEKINYLRAVGLRCWWEWPQEEGQQQEGQQQEGQQQEGQQQEGQQQE
jgi:hypothetical protein